MRPGPCPTTHQITTAPQTLHLHPNPSVRHSNHKRQKNRSMSLEFPLSTLRTVVSSSAHHRQVSCHHSPTFSVFLDSSTFSGSKRSYTLLKVLGDGSFGTVWLCDWHGTLPPNTPLSPMQCGAGARPEWTGKRLVAVKRMKKRWEGGWDECSKLKELEVCRSFPFLDAQ